MDDSALTPTKAVAGVGVLVLVVAAAIFGVGGALPVAAGESPTLAESPTHPTPINMNRTGNQSNLHTLPAETENDSNLHTLPAETENESNRHPQDITLEDAKKQALSAERSRVTQALDNASYVTSSSVGVYSDPTATVLDTNSTSIKVRVEMPYSYEYSCDGSTGAVDGLQTTVVYQVTDTNVSVVTITEDIRNACA